jgi:hypothetical protein
VIARVARTTAVVCLVLALAFAMWKRTLAAPLGVLGGGLLIGLSFWAMRGAVDALISAQKRPGFLLVKFFTRHGIVALAAYGMMVRLQLDPLGLLLGVSSLGVATAVEGLKSLRWRRFP